MKNMALLGISLILFTSCGREKVVTYEVPKEPSASPSSTMGTPEDVNAVQAARAAMAAQTPVKSTFSSELPAGWSEAPGSGMRKMSYTIEGSSIDFYLISLSMGDVPSNVNRWRGQVGLAPASPEDITKEVISFTVDGHSVNYIEIYNDDGGKGIIAAIVDLAPQYWYFTAKGSVAELKTQAASIRSFLESIKFN